MPQYFFDTSDGDSVFEDMEGMELADESAARAAALRGLADMAHDTVPTCRPGTRIWVRIRDRAGASRFNVSLVLDAG